MPRTFDVHIPVETAYVREVLFAAEMIDVVTLARVSAGLDVTATGVSGKPIVNRSGFFVWRVEPGAQPQEIIVEPGALPYESARVAVPPPPVPPAREWLVSVPLLPRRHYAFASGISGVRATLVEQFPATPQVPVADTVVFLQWVDDQAPGTAWRDAPTRARTDAEGDFVALLKLLPQQVARVNASGGFEVRLAVTHSGNTRFSIPFSLPQGRVVDPQPFARASLTP